MAIKVSFNIDMIIVMRAGHLELNAVQMKEF